MNLFFVCNHSFSEKTETYLKKHHEEGYEVELKDAYTKEVAYIWKLGTFESTMYGDDSNVLEEWEECYLPDDMKMQVLGEVHRTSSDLETPSLVLMRCEDEKIYAYDEQRLHLVAENLTQLSDEGISYPSKTYYSYWQTFEDMVTLKSYHIQIL